MQQHSCAACRGTILVDRGAGVPKRSGRGALVSTHERPGAPLPTLVTIALEWWARSVVSDTQAEPSWVLRFPLS